MALTRSLFVPDKTRGFTPALSSNQLRVFGAYSRRIKEGMKRLGTEVLENDLLASAFAEDDGGITLVLLNRSTRPLLVTTEGLLGTFLWKESVSPYDQNSVESMVDPREPVLVSSGALVTLSSIPLGRKSLH
jgi:hypothetical protein